MGALSKFSNHLNDSQKRLVLNSIVKSQFSYCPFVWMFCSRTFNSMINKVHERALRVILNNHGSDFETLLQNNNDVCNHDRNIQILLIEIFKIKKGFAPLIMGYILKERKIHRTLEIFKNLGQKEKELYILVYKLLITDPRNHGLSCQNT